MNFSLKQLRPQALRRRHYRARNAYDTPRRHWWMGIAVFSAVVLCGSAVLARMYYVHESYSDIVGTHATSTPTYNSALVTSVVDRYQAREAAYRSLIETGAAARPAGVATSSEAVASSTEAVSDDIDQIETFASSDEVVE